MSIIQLNSLTKKFDAVTAVDNISFEAEAGTDFRAGRSRWCRQDHDNQDAGWHNGAYERSGDG